MSSGGQETTTETPKPTKVNNKYQSIKTQTTVNMNQTSMSKQFTGCCSAARRLHHERMNPLPCERSVGFTPRQLLIDIVRPLTDHVGLRGLEQTEAGRSNTRRHLASAVSAEVALEHITETSEVLM